MDRQEVERLVEQWCRETSSLTSKQCSQLAPRLTDHVMRDCDLDDLGPLDVMRVEYRMPTGRSGGGVRG